MTTGRSPLVEEVLSGTNRELVLLAASGMVPLPPPELIPLQLTLTRHRDPVVAHRAVEGLAGLEAAVVEQFLRDDADPEALRYFASRSKETEILEAILRRRDVPVDIVRALASKVSAELQETLLLRQDLIVEAPDVLEALERNPQVSAYARRRIREYRQHLVRPQEAVLTFPAAVPEEVTDEEVVRALNEVRGEPREGQVDESTGLSEGQIRALPIPVRLKLARGASKSLRNILVRDPNCQVALEVLRSNVLGDQESEQIARSRVVLDDVLEEMGKRRDMLRRYNVVHALAGNPKTPLPTALRLVSRLSIRDLRILSRDRNVADAVRATAKRLVQVKLR